MMIMLDMFLDMMTQESSKKLKLLLRHWLHTIAPLTKLQAAMQLPILKSLEYLAIYLAIIISKIRISIRISKLCKIVIKSYVHFRSKTHFLSKI